MNCDSAFPDYTKKITYLLLVLAAVGGIVTQLIWGWRVSVAFSLAALFHAAFFLFLRKKYLDWTETGRDIFFIGRRIAGFASGKSSILKSEKRLSDFGLVGKRQNLASGIFLWRSEQILKDERSIGARTTLSFQWHREIPLENNDDNSPQMPGRFAGNY